VDINSDLGEGYGAWRMGDDDALLAVVTSANIACGFHAGDPQIMRRTVEVAAEHGVAVGAHVSFPDRQGFGRRDLDIRPADVTDDVTYQIGALDAFARAAGSRVSYVKPHGALYNRMMVDEDLASAVVGALARFDRRLLLLALPGSAAGAVAERTGVPVVAEGFADRAYTADGTLVPRGQEGAVVSDIDDVASRAVRMAVSQTVTAIDGSEVALPVASLCVHGDTPDAVGIARAVRTALEQAGVPIGAFAADR
jgi:5-oxoprolinase (ATP-hydrolysing) subunit A